jgi:hypothetical protein
VSLLIFNPLKREADDDDNNNNNNNNYNNNNNNNNNLSLNSYPPESTLSTLRNFIYNNVWGNIFLSVKKSNVIT